MAKSIPETFKDRFLAETHRHGNELLFVSIVDNFQCYLSDILLEIFAKNPNSLSGKSTSNSVIFQFADMLALRQHIINRAVLDLAYRSIEDLDNYLSSQLKFRITSNSFERLKLNRYIKIRNVIAHNRGVINQQFVDKCGAKADIIGKQVPIPYKHSVDSYLIRLARRIDFDAISKFSLASIVISDQSAGNMNG